MTEQICTGRTGHAEVIKVTYDPAVVTLSKILEIFFKTHDLTTLNQQGNDCGTQYRSVIYYADDQQKTITEDAIAKIEAAQIYKQPIVT